MSAVGVAGKRSGEETDMSSSPSFKTFYAQVAGVADVAYVCPFRDDDDEEHEGGDADGGRASVSAMRDAARGRERALAFFVPAHRAKNHPGFNVHIHSIKRKKTRAFLL